MSGFAGVSGSHNEFVTNGLVQYMDAQSFQGGGSNGATWPAITGNNGTVYLTSGTVGVTKGPVSYLNFSPAGYQGISLPTMSSMTNFTVECWFYLTASITSSVTAMLTDRWSGSGKINFCLGLNPAGYATPPFKFGVFDGSSWYLTSGMTPTLNTWYQSVGTYDGATLTQYSNGTSQSTLSYNGTTGSNGTGIRIASRWDDQSTTSCFFPGYISVVRIYNRALSANEVLQNFKATRNKHGI